MRSGMAGKHDEMLIYILHSADLAATAGTNLLLSVERQCWRQAARQRWTNLSASVHNSPGPLPRFLSWHGAVTSTDLKILPGSLQDQIHSERRKGGEHRAADSWCGAVGRGALGSPSTP